MIELPCRRNYSYDAAVRGKKQRDVLCRVKYTSRVGKYTHIESTNRTAQTTHSQPTTELDYFLQFAGGAVSHVVDVLKGTQP